MNGSWLPLTDYSSKYKVSVSTLRRRIKGDDIKFRFQDGKYLILDEPPESSPALDIARPSHQSDPSDVSESIGAAKAAIEARLDQRNAKDEPILLAANKLLNELKKAYTQILQEKEEQILHLKEEVADLKTLVRVLESENLRMRK